MQEEAPTEAAAEVAAEPEVEVKAAEGTDAQNGDEEAAPGDDMAEEYQTIDETSQDDGEEGKGRGSQNILLIFFRKDMGFLPRETRK